MSKKTDIFEWYNLIQFNSVYYYYYYLFGIETHTKYKHQQNKSQGHTPGIKKKFQKIQNTNINKTKARDIRLVLKNKNKNCNPKDFKLNGPTMEENFPLTDTNKNMLNVK